MPPPLAGAAMCQLLLMHCNKRHAWVAMIYSITSSARASSVAGTFEAERLGGLQVDDELELGRLHTGRSAGFAPLRMRPA